jgi:hypothetical protein
MIDWIEKHPNWAGAFVVFLVLAGESIVELLT